MKKLLVLFIFTLSQVVLFGQSRSIDVEYQKQSRPAVINEIPFSEKTIEKALEDTFAKLGYKSTTVKGFTVYKGVRLRELGPDSYDIYFKAEKKSRRDNDNSTVTMMVSKGFDEFAGKTVHTEVHENSKRYLDSLKHIVARFDLEQQIIEQEDQVKKADKKNTDLQDEAKDLEKKQRKLEEQVSDNKKDQDNQVKELEKQRQILEVLKSQRIK